MKIWLLVFLSLSFVWGCSARLTPSATVPVLEPAVSISRTVPPVATPTPTASPTPTGTPTIPTFTPTMTSSATPEPTLTPTVPPGASFSFYLASDMTNHTGPGEYDTSRYFRGVLEAMLRIGRGAFLISPGDASPISDTYWTIQQVLGKDTLWYPVLGMHDFGTKDIQFLRDFNYDLNGAIPPNITRQGPPSCPQTTYAFDYGSAHFVVLNVYCSETTDGRTDAAIGKNLLEWLEKDLDANDKKIIFVIGHEPAFPQRDQELNVLRHKGDALDQYPVTRDRFWELLKKKGVTAYITGHTHSYSLVNIEGVWQLDVGHAMGIGTQATRSTFVRILIDGESVAFETYRGNKDGTYTIHDQGILK
jgi:hypothetical protein